LQKRGNRQKPVKSPDATPNQRKKKWTVTGESLSTVLGLSVVVLWSKQKRDFQTLQRVIKIKEKAPKSHDFSAFLVEISGIEPLTS